ncbi:MAG TPA: aminotransferase class IV [Solirubrobacterales bacterium]|jgi:branched-chain amino acid aminotransferase
MRSEPLASVDGRITPTAEAVIPLADDGVYRGDGAFEVIRLYGGKPFALDEHLERLERSAEAIDLDFDGEALRTEIDALLDRHGDEDAIVRVLVTRGGRRIAATEPLPQYGDSTTVASVTYRTTVILDGVKSLSYAANMHATRIARSRGADEAVLVSPEGTVLEPPTSAIFWATPEGVLRTPSLANPILDSITRRHIMRAVEVEEGTFHIDDLRGASEAFLASTTREVHPVAAVDGQTLEWPGPRTLEARAALARAIEADING